MGPLGASGWCAADYLNRDNELSTSVNDFEQRNHVHTSREPVNYRSRSYIPEKYWTLLEATFIRYAEPYHSLPTCEQGNDILGPWNTWFPDADENTGLKRQELWYAPGYSVVPGTRLNEKHGLGGFSASRVPSRGRPGGGGYYNPPGTRRTRCGFCAEVTSVAVGTVAAGAMYSLDRYVTGGWSSFPLHKNVFDDAVSLVKSSLSPSHLKNRDD